MIRNHRDVNRLETGLTRIQQRINRFSEDYFDQEIKVSWENMKISASKEKLQTMSIEVISTLEKGAPINQLVNNGFQTVYDIEKQKPAELMLIDGISEKSAYTIYDAVSKIKASVYQQAIPSINPDNLSEESIELLASIYKKWRLLKVVAALKTDFKELNKAVGPDIEITKRQKGPIGTLFLSKAEKGKVKSAFNNLNQDKHIKKLDSIHEKLNNILRFTVNRNELIQHFAQENAAYYTEIEKVTGFKKTETSGNLTAETIEAVNTFPLDTTGLDIALSHYQTFGAKYALHHKRTLFGDEIESNKTIQTLAMINHVSQKNQKYAMIVCPLSVVENWEKEIKQHSKLETFFFHGNKRDAVFAKWQSNTGILITTYEQTLRMNFEEGHQLDVLIVDEAHYVKNPEAKRSQRIYKLASLAEYVLFMSDTPLENRLEELKQLTSILQPGIAEQLSQGLHSLKPNEIMQVVAPVYLKRNRKDGEETISAPNL